MADNYLERKFERASSIHTFKPLPNKEEKKDEEK